MEEVVLHWYGPYDPELFYKSDLAMDVMGVYMFLDSEYHQGRNAWTQRLLYIGMVYDQTFNERLLQRGDDVWLWIQNNYEYEVTFKAARIGLPGRQRISPELVQAVESLLIGVMQPRGNIRSARTYRWRPLKITNMRQFKANTLDQRLGLE